MYMYFVDEENLKDAKKRGLLHMCTHACAHTHTHTGTSEWCFTRWTQTLAGGLPSWFDDFLHASYQAQTFYSSFSKLFWLRMGRNNRGSGEEPGKEVTGNLSFLPGAVCSAVSLQLRVGRKWGDAISPPSRSHYNLPQHSNPLYHPGSPKTVWPFYFGKWEFSEDQQKHM